MSDMYTSEPRNERTIRRWVAMVKVKVKATASATETVTALMTAVANTHARSSTPWANVIPIFPSFGSLDDSAVSDAVTLIFSTSSYSDVIAKTVGI